MVTLTIKAAQEMPRDGAGGSGREPTSVPFRWTEVLTATGGRGATVRASRTELRESSSQSVIAFTGPPAGSSVRPGVPLELPVIVAGFGSALHPGQWEGRASVDIVHPSGRVETIPAAFSFK